MSAIVAQTELLHEALQDVPVREPELALGLLVHAPHAIERGADVLGRELADVDAITRVAALARFTPFPALPAELREDLRPELRRVPGARRRAPRE